MATKHDPGLVDRFARSVAAALAAELGEDAALAGMVAALPRVEDDLQPLYEDVIMALERSRKFRDEQAAE